jgi:uroporphyrinogen-III synthase
MQKTKWRILSTGALPETIVQNAAAQNVVIDVFPFIQTKSIIDYTTSTRLQELFQNLITAVFTSKNAVMAVAEHFQNPIAWKVFSIGVTTAKGVTQFLGTQVAGRADDASALAEIIIQSGSKEVYFFCGNIRRDDLPEMLRNANILVHEIVVYETITTPHTLTQRYDAVLFYSPSAVQSYFSANQLDPKTMLFAIGDTTAAEVRQHTSMPVFIASKPDKEILVLQAIDHLTSKEETK